MTKNSQNIQFEWLIEIKCFFRKIYDFRKSGAHQTVSTELIVYNRKANHKSAEHFLKESKTPKQNNEKKKNRIHKSDTRNAGAGCVGVFHSTSFFKKNATVFFLSLSRLLFSLPLKRYLCRARGCRIEHIEITHFDRMQEKRETQAEKKFFFAKVKKREAK